MFFTGKKVASIKKSSATSIIDSHRQAREERLAAKLKQDQIVFTQALLRRKLALLKHANLLRAHYIVENVHFKLENATNRVAWLMQAVREYVFVAENLSHIDANFALSIVPYINEEYKGISKIPDLAMQWKLQIVKLFKVWISKSLNLPELVPPMLFLLPSLSDSPHNLLISIISSIKESFVAIPYSLFTSPHLEDVLLISTTIFQQFIGTSSIQTPIELECKIEFLKMLSTLPLNSKMIENKPLTNLLLELSILVYSSLSQTGQNPYSPPSKSNYIDGSLNLQNRLKLFGATIQASTPQLELRAAELSYHLEEYRNFLILYKKELEDEENYLDATDLENIDTLTERNKSNSSILSQTFHDLFATTMDVFSEQNLTIMFDNISTGKSDLDILKACCGISQLVSRLKNLTTFRVGAFSSLAIPLVSIWKTLHAEYSKESHKLNSIDAQCSLYGMFCSSYASLLATRITDSQFYTTQTYAKLQDNLQMVNFFKSVIKYRLKFAFEKPVPAEFQHFMQSFNLLLREFHRFNRRKTWAKTDDLLLAELRHTKLHSSISAYYNIPLYCPMLIPMLEKVRLLNDWIQEDREALEQDMFFQEVAPMIQIRRGPLLLSDAFRKLMPLHSRLKQGVKVQFLAEDGTPEPGIDGGGLFRELFTEVVKLAFSPEFALFKSSSFNELYPNPYASTLVGDANRKFLFLGQLLGKCIYESLLVDLPLAPFFLNHILGYVNSCRDFIHYDESVFGSIQQLLEMDSAAISELGLNFTFGSEDAFGNPMEVELKPNGSQIPLTAENLIDYIDLVADFKLNRSIQGHSQAFLRGLSDVIKPSWLRLFSEDELALVICGGGRLDIEDMRHFVELSGGFHDHHPTIIALWEVLEDLTSEEQQQFLKFVTSVSRPPLLGFSALNPRLCIRLNKTDTSFLPTANTCMNLLKLPPYQSKQKLKEKLLYAIKSGARFELS